MFKLSVRKVSSLVFVLGVVSSFAANASCYDVSRQALQSAANNVVRNTSDLSNPNGAGGFGLNMWVTMVDETGKVCHVVTTGTQGAAAGNSEWLGSRVISAQKANTANAFSLDGVSISSGALYAAVQPGGSLFGLQHSNPVDASQAYQGSPYKYGTHHDPLIGKRIGGVNVFGGGIALYNSSGVKVGAIGVSGDTSCTDHAFAWKVREALALDSGSPGGFETLDLSATFTALGDHPNCAADTALDDVAAYGFANN